MRKFFFLTATGLLLRLTLASQDIQLTVDGKTNNGVRLQQVKIDVKVCGTIARTTWEMVFKNNTNRILEGNLNFPLKDGLSVSRYALDINGKMREAVPVDRAKGTEVFEAIESRRVDPGLLEKLDGNTFRTRIYPINPHSTRTVIIGYEEELHAANEASLNYYLPLNLKDTVSDFSLLVSVIQNAAPPVFDPSLTDNLRFSRHNNLYEASVQRKDYVPAVPLSFSIPRPTDATDVMLQEFEGNYCFVINTLLNKNERERKLPSTIALLWDASLSGAARNSEKEMKLLDAYLRRVGNAEVRLTVFSNTIRSVETFSVAGGNWQSLRNALDSTRYDGATNFGNLNLKDIRADEFLLFSDGRHTLGDGSIQLPAKPVYCVNSSVMADYSQLKMLAFKTGGAVVDLQKESPEEALRKLTHESFRFLGIRQNDRVKEYYPSLPVAVNGAFSVAGITQEDNREIVLLFGYGNQVTVEKKISINSETQLCGDFDITRVYAQKKISELDIFYDRNRPEIERLGRQFGIVTRNTSLIVLETLNDYVRYKVEPPAELRPEYERIMKQQQDRIVRNEEAQSGFRQMIEQLKDWYKIPPEKNTVAATGQPQPATNPAPQQAVQPTASATSNPATAATGSRVVAGRVTDAQGNPVSFATIKIKGTRTGVSTDANGNYSVRVNPGAVLLVSGAGFREVEAPVGTQSTLHTILEKGAADLKEVVVISAYGIKRSSHSTTSSVQTLSGDQVNTIKQTNVAGALAGKTSGIQVQNSQVFKLGAEPGIRMRGENEWAYHPNGMVFNTDTILRKKELVQTTTADPQAPFNIDNFDYMKELKRTSASERYAKYMQLRSYYFSKPTYFFEVGSWFLKTGDREHGLIILSNLAELENSSYELYKMLGYKLKEAGDYADELSVFKKVLELRPSDPQSYRDCALAYADLGRYQEALDMLYEGMTKRYSPELRNKYNGIEEVFLTEINHIVSMHRKQVNTQRIGKELIVDMPMDVRVVMNWNKNNSDIDLWVTDPAGEKCYYGNRKTKSGGRMSDDFTDGFGPEQFLLKTGEKGKYRIQVNYYSDRQFTIAGPTTAMAEIYLHYGTAKEERKIICLQMQKGKEGEVFIGEVEL